MDEIQSTYQKRKKRYLALLASVVALVVVFRLTAPLGYNSFQANLLKLACLLVVLLVARNIFRCPKCEALLAQAFYSSWCKLRYCPKCGVRLTEE